MSRHQIFTTLAGSLLLAASGAGHALDYQINDFDIELISSVTAGLAMRTQDANRELIGKANNVPGNSAPNSALGSYSVNSDDGNQSFSEAGDVFFSQIKLSSELKIQRGDWGVFARGNYRYDPRLEDDDFFPAEDFGPGRSRSNAFLANKNSNVQDAIANDAELFDLYLFGNFNVADRNVSVRLGRQVINWGESTFIQNGINSIVPIDARQARGPGAEVKEVFRPFNAVYLSTALTDTISLEGFYQLEWEETIPDPAGTFFSTTDFVGAGGTDAMIGFGRCNENTPSITAGGACPPGMGDAPGGTNIPRGANNEPSDSGQYGGRLNFYLEWLNSTDLSLYAMNYHSRLPLISGRTVDTFVPLDTNGDGTIDTNLPITGSGRYLLDYPEDIKLYGLSFNSYLAFANVAVQGEISVKQDQPLQVDDVDILLFALGADNSEPSPAVQFTTYSEFTNTPFAPGKRFDGYIRRDVYQWDISFTKILGPNWTGANQTIMLAEFAGMHVSGMPDTSELPLDAPATYVPNQTTAAALVTSTPAQDPAGYADADSWGYRLALALRYQNVLNRFNLTPSLRFFHDVDGNSPTPVRNHMEGTKQASLGLTAEYLDAWEAGLSYTAFWGGLDTNAGPNVPNGVRGGGYTNNLFEDRDFVNVFMRYTF
ncbi:DUF1302 domain-containing protein [Spectribacter hydrogenoxidans]|uniref:DUF1302 domain-containing protein n=1 Tax=Spectribacter hydrogenoxidans TaxID=3075608 RepID=A0ABU3BX83_9GAMM|nr:DUF1302 domain-containing protein [Salinisphaera sp. W335]MDT0633916.1 DUF1302 domain-containing protein [Salinisphaera sp. W335]